MIGNSKILAGLLAPLNEPLADPRVTDICVNEPHCVWIRRAGQWATINVPSFNFDLMDAATIKIGAQMKREFDEATPYVNCALPGGERFQGVREPGTKEGHLLWAIRRPPATARTIDDDDFEGLFAETNTKPPRRQRAKADLSYLLKNRRWTDLFRTARLAGMSIAFCGPTGSGKSDLVRRCIGVSRDGSRMVTVQTEDEFGNVGPPNKAGLLYDDTKMTADEAIRIAKRLIPNEIVMQEVRGAEAFSLLLAMNSGHNGCTTWHADPGREIDALMMMARQHPAGRVMDREQLHDMAERAFDLIAYCQQDDKTGKWAVDTVRIMGEGATS